MIRVYLSALFVIALAAGTLKGAGTLDIYFIDVEGGQSTLVITPAGETVLIDAGYGARNGRDPDRIMATIHAAGADHIDYFLATHFHPDHVGGVPELAARIPINTFIDYGSPMGTDRMATGSFRTYEESRRRGQHLMPQPGDRLPFKGVEAEVVSAAGVLVSKPLRGGGQANGACATLQEQEEDGTENFRSIGVRFTFGAFKFVDLGDLSGNTLGMLVCPVNLVGEASVYLVSHHGNYDTDVPAVLAALKPQVAIMNNGLTKGGAPTAFVNLHRQPGLELWQLHASRNDGAQNAEDFFIANVDDGATAYWIKLRANDDGRFTMFNSRTGFVKQYLPKGRAPRVLENNAK